LVSLSDIESEVLTVIRESPERLNVTGVVERLKKRFPDTGRDYSQSYVTNTIIGLEEKGIIETENVGVNKYIDLVDGLEFTEEGVYIPTPYMTDMTAMLKSVLDMFIPKGKMKKNILTLFSENPQYHNPQGLYHLLIRLKIDPDVAYTISNHVFSSVSGQQFPMQPFGPYAPCQAQIPPTFTYNQFGQSPYVYPPTQSQPRVIQPSNKGPEVITLGPNQPPIVVFPEKSEPKIETKISERKIIKYKLDEDGNPKLDKDGNPIVDSVVIEPVVVGGSQQTNFAEMFKAVSGMFAEAIRAVREGEPKSPLTLPIDEEKIILKTKESIKPELDRLESGLGRISSDFGSALKDLANKIGTYFEIQAAIKPYEEQIKTLREYTGDNPQIARLKAQENLIKYAVDKLDIIPSIAEEIMKTQRIQYLQMLEQQQGLEPGTLVIPVMRDMVRTKHREPPETSHEERREALERLKRSVG